MSTFVDKESQCQEILATATDVADFVRQLTTVPHDGPDRRADPRTAIMVFVRATPCDATGKPCGTPFPAVTRDISESGISILHSMEVKNEFLLLEFTSSLRGASRLVLEISRCRSIGPFWEVAGRFLTAAPA